MNWFVNYLAGMTAWFAATGAYLAYNEFTKTGEWWWIVLAIAVGVVFWFALDWHASTTKQAGS